ncbi:Uncharacterized protein C17C9.11c [Golovinomyces cichoracearum]|uniref:Uncharacterized protein C17C9.11c n=1 Tax=Golovinomyces cichoracearum TaxID=62708 RepID=A0A420IKI1_9PEZI|nr:Uncharacterized protein C17C9.11c [Golovinomyces cichoracearum]
MGISDLDNLIEFGYPRDRAQLALKKGESLQNALEWLNDNENKTFEELNDSADPENQAIDPTPLAAGEIAKSMICDDCGKKLRSMIAVQNHSRLSGHENFSESNEEIAPLTEEEKIKKLEELRAKNREKKNQQAIIDKEEQRKNEKIRMKSTREVQDAREKLAQQEQMKAAAKKRQEKLEDIAAKKRIQEKIAADKEARRLKSEAQKAERQGIQNVVESPDKAAIPSETAKLTPNKSFASEARLRIQYSRGTMTLKVPSETTLFALGQQIEAEIGGSVSSFTTTFPKKTFSGALDFSKTLRESGLIPSAVLIVN